ncbi:MAG: hypothetical protein P1U62_13670, partial [Alteraurantiacibacter sp. bin_em_oilr2.035]|nr:hypothetical protein [Alteraurantiacibacter sp. bin_em_oilr2.035]
MENGASRLADSDQSKSVRTGVTESDDYGSSQLIDLERLLDRAYQYKYWLAGIIVIAIVAAFAIT